MNRRVKVHTPFGSVISKADANGTFSVCLLIRLSLGLGEGFDPVNNTYSAEEGSLTMYGQNLRGLKRDCF